MKESKQTLTVCGAARSVGVRSAPLIAVQKSGTPASTPPGVQRQLSPPTRDPYDGTVAPVCGTAPSAKVDGASTRDVGSIIVVIATDAPLTRAS